MIIHKRNFSLMHFSYIAVWVLFLATAAVLFYVLKTGHLNDEYICSPELFGKDARVVVHQEDDGQMVCLRKEEKTPSDYKKFPGGTPYRHNDPRWMNYIEEHPYKAPQ